MTRLDTLFPQAFSHSMMQSVWSCMPTDRTQALTPTGWVSIHEKPPVIAQYTTTGAIEFVEADWTIYNYTGPMHYPIAGIEGMFTPDHRIIHKVEDRCHATLAKNNGALPWDTVIPTTGEYLGSTEGRTTTDSWLQLEAMISADGTLDNSPCSWLVRVKKQRKIDRLLLLTSGIETRERTSYKHGLGVVIPNNDFTKEFPTWLLHIPLRQRQLFIEEVGNWDSHRRGNYYYYYSTVKGNADLLHTLCHISGYTSTLSVSSGQRPSSSTSGELHQDTYCVSVSLKQTRQVRRKSWRTKEYTGEVGCPTVPSSMWLARYDNCIYVTGNCEMKFFRQHCQRLTTGHARSSDLIAGGHFAKACEIVRKSFYNDKLSIDNAIELGYNSIIESEDTGDYIKSNRRLAICLKKHFKLFPLDNNLTPVKLSNGEHAIEYAFDFELGIEHPDIPGTSIRYKGLLDGLYEKTHLGKRVGTYVVDEKTCSSVFRVQGTKIVDIAKEEDKYKTEGQMIGYHWAARQLGLKPTGTLIYKIPLTKDFESSFCLEIPINDYLVDIWSATLCNKIEELKDKYLFYKNQDHLPHYSFYPALTDSTCVSYGRRCSFTDGCRYKGEDVMAMTHEQRIWDSTSKRDYTLKEYKQLKGIK